MSSLTRKGNKMKIKQTKAADGTKRFYKKTEAHGWKRISRQRWEEIISSIEDAQVFTIDLDIIIVY